MNFPMEAPESIRLLNERVAEIFPDPKMCRRFKFSAGLSPVANAALNGWPFLIRRLPDGAQVAVFPPTEPLDWSI